MSESEELMKELMKRNAEKGIGGTRRVDKNFSLHESKEEKSTEKETENENKK